MPTKRRILSPHKQQERYVYLRMLRVADCSYLTSRAQLSNTTATLTATCTVRLPLHIGYSDKHPDQRIISSSRVEEAVEVADYLARCYERGWHVIFGPTLVSVSEPYPGEAAHAPTIREAYWRLVNVTEVGS